MKFDVFISFIAIVYIVYSKLEILYEIKYGNYIKLEV